MSLLEQRLWLLVVLSLLILLLSLPKTPRRRARNLSQTTRLWLRRNLRRLLLPLRLKAQTLHRLRSAIQPRRTLHRLPLEALPDHPTPKIPPLLSRLRR